MLFLVACILVFVSAGEWDDAPCFSFVREIDVSYTGGTLTNHPVLLVLDTLDLHQEKPPRFSQIVDGRCVDMRFRLKTTKEWVTHWAESSCPSEYTRIWIEVPSLTGDFTLEWFYHCRSTITVGTEEVFDGKFIALSTQPCVSPWEDFGSGWFLKIAPTATTVGTYQPGKFIGHRHEYLNTWTTTPVSTVSCDPTGSSGMSLALHEHELRGNTTAGATTEPKHMRAPLCRSSLHDAKTNMLMPYDHTSAPSGSQPYADINGYLLRGFATHNQGVEFGDDDHFHNWDSSVDVVMRNPETESTLECAAFSTGTSVVTSYVGHPHKINNYAQTGTQGNLPVRTRFPFARIQSPTDYPFNDKSYMFVTKLPPMGYQRISTFDDTYISAGVTPVTTEIATALTHTHAFLAMDAPESTMTAQEQTSGGNVVAEGPHIHSATYDPALSHSSLLELDRQEVILARLEFSSPPPTLGGSTTQSETQIRSTAVGLPLWAQGAIAGGSVAGVAAVIVVVAVLITVITCVAKRGGNVKVKAAPQRTEMRDKKKHHHDSSSSSD